jgi:predicted enzyme related to lactoylglutathione lyase
MPRVVHFEINAVEPDRAARFYADAFGWRARKWEGPMDYWMIITGEEGEPGINGGMMKKCEQSPAGTVNTIAVPSVDEYVAKITAAGGKITVPKMAIPTVGYVAYFQDPEGNAFGIMEEDESAA